MAVCLYSSVPDRKAANEELGMLLDIWIIQMGMRISVSQKSTIFLS